MADRASTNSQRVTNANLRSDINHLGEKLADYDARVCKRLDDHEQRIRAQEKGWWKLLAAALPGVGVGIRAWIAGS